MLITLILLVAMVGAIALVLVRERVFVQPVFKQVLRKTTTS